MCHERCGNIQILQYLVESSFVLQVHEAYGAQYRGGTSLPYVLSSKGSLQYRNLLVIPSMITIQNNALEAQLFLLK